MKLKLAFLAALILAPSVACAQPGPFALCTPLFNATTGAVSCVPVGQTSPNITAPNPLPVGGVANAAAPTFGEGRAGYLSFDLAGALRTTATITPGGTQDVNLTQILGAAPSLTNPLWVFPATGATFPVSGAVTATQATAANLNATVVGTGTFATQSAVTAASGSFASGAFASGSFASGSHASGSFASGAFASGSVASGAYASGSLASGAMVDLVALSAPVAPATATATKSVLLGAQATTAAVNPSTGQQSALSSDTNNNLLTSSGGAPNVTTSQVTVLTSSTSVCPARALRRSCAVSTITGTQQVFCSGTTATTANGQIFPAVVGASFPFQTTAAVNCIAVSSSQVVSVVETF